MNIVKMAWRNVWRNSRRSSVTIAAMTLALVVELLYSGLVTGMVYGMEDDVTEFELGDLQVFKDGYLTRPSLYEKVDDPGAIVEKLEGAGYKATIRLFAGGLAASGESSSGAAFIGLDPVKDAEVLSLDEAMAEGQWLSNDDPKGVVIGRGLARILGADLGSEIVVLSQGADGSVANDLFTVRGVLLSVAAGLDRGTILMPERTFRELMVFPEGAHKIIVRAPADANLAHAGAEVKQLLGVPEVRDPEDPHPLDVMTWKEISPMLAQMLDSVQGVVAVVYFIVYLAVGILILNAMLMAVFERIREFGVLKAIGYGPGQVLVMMVLEGMFQAVVATVVGFVLAAPLMYYLQVYGINVGVLGGMNMAGMTMPPVWKAHYAVETLRVPVVMLYVIVFGAVIWPALKAAWIKPVEAMQHQ